MSLTPISPTFSVFLPLTIFKLFWNFYSPSSSVPIVVINTSKSFHQAKPPFYVVSSFTIQSFFLPQSFFLKQSQTNKQTSNKMKTPQSMILSLFPSSCVIYSSTHCHLVFICSTLLKLFFVWSPKIIYGISNLILVEISAAFDTVDLSLSFHKMHSLVLYNANLPLFFSFYSYCFFCAHI